MDKLNKQFPLYEEDEGLTFTEEDRMETFRKIQKNYARKKNNDSFYRIGKRHAGPILGTIMVLLLTVGVFLPNLYQNHETSQPIGQQVAKQEDISFSVLLLGKDSTEHSRSTINILLTYNGENNSMKVVPIPRDTYVDIFNAEGKKVWKDKLMHSLPLNSSPNSVLQSVSKLFDISIDYYSIIPQEDIYAELGISKNEIRGNNIKIKGMGDLIKERLSFSQIKNLLEDSETNIPNDLLKEIRMEKSTSQSIQVIDMEKGIEGVLIDGIYYVKITQNLLETTSNTLKRHLGEDK